MPFKTWMPKRKKGGVNPLPLPNGDDIKDEDLTTEDERRINERLVTPTEIMEKLKPIEAKGFLGSISYWLSELMTKYRYKAVGFFISFVSLWLLLNNEITVNFFKDTFGTEPSILNWDPYPHKLLMFILSFAGTILTQILLIHQKKDEILDKERVKAILQIASQNQNQLGLMKERLQVLTRKLTELSRTQYKLLDFTTLMLSTVADEEEKTPEEGDIEDTKTGRTKKSKRDDGQSPLE